MYLSGISILFVATLMLISISAVPAPSVYQMDNGIDNAESREMSPRSNELAQSLYKRNSPLCDYRLQFRPLPLKSALCGNGHTNQDEDAVQMNPFKYG